MFLPVRSDLLFQGREGDPRLGQWVKALTTLPTEDFSAVVFGCPSDTGVQVNHGRLGAKEGPDAIRTAFYRMAVPMHGHWQGLRLGDLGNILISSSLEDTHAKAKQVAHALSSLGTTVVVLGGGHDFAGPCFTGFMEGCAKPKVRFGLINVDPHLDVRPPIGGLFHSGTPFRVVLESGLLPGKNFTQFGTRANRNAQTHYQYCVKKGVKIQTLDKIQSAKTSPSVQFGQSLKKLLTKANVLGVSIDMDACFEAEGTSAAPVVGFSAWEMMEMARLAGATSQVRYFEIAEVAPPLDPTGRSARIAAELLFAFFEGRASTLQKKKK